MTIIGVKITNDNGTNNPNTKPRPHKISPLFKNGKKYPDPANPPKNAPASAGIGGIGMKCKNPFNPNTTIIVNIVQKLHATSVRIYNLNGRLVDLVFQGELETGTHKFHWNGSRNSSSVYFIRLQSGDFVKTHKMILLK